MWKGFGTECCQINDDVKHWLVCWIEFSNAASIMTQQKTKFYAICWKYKKNPMYYLSHDTPTTSVSKSCNIYSKRYRFSLDKNFKRITPVPYAITVLVTLLRSSGCAYFLKNQLTPDDPRTVIAMISRKPEFRYSVLFLFFY